MNQILTDNQQIYYVVRVNGANITAPVTSKQVAESTLNTLPPETQALAEVVSVTSDGKELLFG